MATRRPPKSTAEGEKETINSLREDEVAGTTLPERPLTANIHIYIYCNQWWDFSCHPLECLTAANHLAGRAGMELGPSVPKNCICFPVALALLVIFARLGVAEDKASGDDQTISPKVKTQVLAICDARREALKAYYLELSAEYPSRLPRTGDREKRLALSPNERELLSSTFHSLLVQSDKDWELLNEIVRAFAHTATDDGVVQLMSEVLHQEINGKPGKFERGCYSTAVAILAEQGTEAALELLYGIAILPVDKTRGLLINSGPGEEDETYSLHIAKLAWSNILEVVKRDQVLPLMQRVAERYATGDPRLRNEIEVNLRMAEAIAAGTSLRPIPHRDSP